MTEGSLQLVNNNRVYTNNSRPKQEGTEKKGYEDEYDEDEDAFLELKSKDGGLFGEEGTSFVHKFVATQTFSYSDNNGEKWLNENKKQCQIDKDGNLDLSVRLIFQYFRSPLDVGGDMGQNANNQEHYGGDNMSALELGESLEDAPESPASLMQMGFFGGDDDDDGGDDGSEGGNAFTSAAKRGLKFSLKKGGEVKQKLGNAIKFLYEKAQVMIAKPEIHIHFVVDDIRIKNCRQPLSWAGEMSSGAMIFVANQNFKVKHDALNVDFLKKAVKVHSSVRGIYDLSFNSCVQVHCTKLTPTTNQYVISPWQGKNFSISNKLMGYFNRPMVQPGQLNYVSTVGTQPPGSGLAPGLAPPVANVPGLAPGLNGVSNNAPIQLHNVPSKPDAAAPTSGAQAEEAAPAKPAPVTNLPGFNGPVAPEAPTTNLGGSLQADDVKSKMGFYIFMAVGVLILISIVYFFFCK